MAGRIPKYDMNHICHYLPYYIQYAFDELRTGTDKVVAQRRKEYESIARDDVPDLVAVEGNNIRRSLAIHALGSMMRAVYGEEDSSWIRQGVENYFLAQDNVLQQQVHKFAACCWHTGLSQMLDESKYTAFSGTFGATTMRSLSTAGRIMFTLARPNPSGRWVGGEDTVTIIGEDGDKTGMRMGIQSVYCDFSTACTLINDVVANWPDSQEKLVKVYKHDRKVSIG